jgi:hypothetical protein
LAVILIIGLLSTRGTKSRKEVWMKVSNYEWGEK